MSFDWYLLIYSSFQTEIPRDAHALFVNALAELRPSLWNYVPKLAHLFDVLSNPSKLKTHQFKIELATDDDIRNSAPDSKLLINAFEYSDSSNPKISIGPLSCTPSNLSQSIQSKQVSNEIIIEASRLALFDDILTYFYITKVDTVLLSD